ncbi:MAG: hemerythrin domain-containing protein [Candidatus Dormibacteria bacterium]
MDAVDLLLADHRAVEKLFGEFVRADAETRQEVSEQIVRELSVHAAIEEETVFYPAVRADVPEGDPLVEHSLDEHQEIKDALARVDDRMAKSHTKEFADKVTRLQEVVDHHVQEEESEVFPAVREALTKTRLNELGTAMNRKKESAPTRPHAHAPNEGIAAEVAGAVAGVVDRVRDGASGRR